MNFGVRFGIENNSQSIGSKWCGTPFLLTKGKTGRNKDKENREIGAKALDSFGFALSRLLQKCEFILHYVQGITMGLTTTWRFTITLDKRFFNQDEINYLNPKHTSFCPNSLGGYHFRSSP